MARYQDSKLKDAASGTKSPKEVAMSIESLSNVLVSLNEDQAAAAIKAPKEANQKANEESRAPAEKTGKKQ